MKPIRSDIEDQRNIIIDELSGFIEIPSVTTDKKQVSAALDYALGLGEKYGFRTTKAADGRVGIIEAGSGDEILGILTHVDVVPEGDPGDWTVPPFEATVIASPTGHCAGFVDRLSGIQGAKRRHSGAMARLCNTVCRQDICQGDVIFS